MAGTAPQIHTVTIDEVRNASIDFSGFLDEGEQLTGTPVVAAPDSMTIENEQLNSDELMINGETVAVSHAVLFQVTATLRGSYTLNIRCGTSANQTIEGTIRLNVRRPG
jgi:hypothetical protein